MVREKHRGRAARREGKPPKEKKVLIPVQQPIRQASHRSATPLHSSRFATATYGGEPFRSREPRNDNYSEKFTLGEIIGFAVAFSLVALLIALLFIGNNKRLSNTLNSNGNVVANAEASPRKE